MAAVVQTDQDIAFLAGFNDQHVLLHNFDTGFQKFVFKGLLLGL